MANQLPEGIYLDRGLGNAQPTNETRILFVDARGNEFEVSLCRLSPGISVQKYGKVGLERSLHIEPKAANSIEVF